MRVDDRLMTVMERAGGSPALRAVGWQQLVDLLSRSSDAEGEVVERAYRALDAWRADTTAERRGRACAAVADAALPPRLFAHLVRDPAEVVAPVLTRARVADDAILAELPRLSGPARALLRHRASPSDELTRALDAYGPADRALRGGVEAAVASRSPVQPSNSPVPIRDLVERIERFRRARPAPHPAARPVAPLPASGLESSRRARHPQRFAFETARDGTVRWTDAALRGAVLGLSLAEVGDGAGVDEATAAAHARRAPIRAGGLTLAGDGALAGDWRLDATPVFAPDDGRFTGYVGHGQRPDAAGAERWALARSDSFRQLMHELKTPLNAVIGFAELIEQQLLGPLPSDYRAEAGRVRRSGLDVLAVLDDVDAAARLDADAEPPMGEGASELSAILRASLDDLGAPSPFVAHPGDERPVAVDATTARRVVDRLLSGLAPLAAAQERLAVTVTGRKRARLRVDLPAALRALPSEQLRALRIPRRADDAAPLLGLEFTLRLVRRLAQEAGGELSVSADQFILSLPVPAQKEATRRR